MAHKHNYELDISRLKETRIQKGLSQKDMALQIDIKPSNLANYENGIESIPIKQFNKMCDYLEITFDYALKLSENNTYQKKNNDLNNEKVGERLKEIRKKNHLYQDTLAREIGTSHSLISEYEKGKKLISLSYAYAICKKYNISLDYLYGKK